MPASRNYASKDTTSRHLLTFVRLALQPKAPMSAITSSMLQKFKMQMPDILLLTRIRSLPKKKRKEDSPYYNFCHARESWFPTLCHNSSDTICYKNNNFEFPKGFPTFWAKKKNYYSLSLFTGTIHRYCSLRNFAYLRGLSLIFEASVFYA